MQTEGVSSQAGYTQRYADDGHPHIDVAYSSNPFDERIRIGRSDSVRY